MLASQLREKYLNFFKARGHRIIPSVSLIPENDPSALFISAGMHPLVPYLLGQSHPSGQRLCSVQKCLRTSDIERVGDTFHQTFFEMLGNWSLGDPASPGGIGPDGYWKEEAIPWSFEFLTKELGIGINRLSVTCFAGDDNAPCDLKSAEVWRKLGIPEKRIYFLPKEDNWWGPAGQVGPCGPDTEMFFDTGKPACGSDCRPGCSCGKYFEIWNNVFMEYQKKIKEPTKKGVPVEYEFVSLPQKNVDTGMGVDRTITVLGGLDDSYQNDLLSPLISRIEEISSLKYSQEKNQKPMRIIADHLRAAVFLISDGVVPGNVEQGYVLRRLIRRAVRHGRRMQLEDLFTAKIGAAVIEKMADIYPELILKKQSIFDELTKEEEKFIQTLGRGIKEFEKMAAGVDQDKKISGKEAFFLYETYGFPIELTTEMAGEKGLEVNEEEYRRASEEHQEQSRIGAEKKFAGGLADHSEIVVKYHTATHLLHAALRKILGEEVRQVGSNLTAERLRFDFTYPRKLTEEEIGQVEDLVNKQIQADLPVKMEIMSLEKARQTGALAFFEQKYSDQVKVYGVEGFSREVCGGPHVKSTGEIGPIKIFKEEAVGTGKRRIYAKIAK